jgi:hypothetical protein
MTAVSLPAAYFAEGDFRIGHVLGRTSAVVSRNFPTLLVVMAAASLPKYLLTEGAGYAAEDRPRALLWASFTVLLWIALSILSQLSQAIVLYGAFQDMLGEEVDLGYSVRVGLRRLLPVVGVATSVTLLGFLGLIVFVVSGLITFTACFVAIPACVVEERGVLASMRKSVDLTAGHRWKIFGLMALMYVVDASLDNAIDQVPTSVAGGVPALAGHLIWSGIWSTFFAILAVVTYHDLRVAREGVETAQIAVVFE